MAFRTPQQKSNRTEALRQVAGQLGMAFHETDEWGTRALLRDFDLCKRGGRRRLTNLMTKTVGLLDEKITIGDYQFTVSTGNSSTTHYQTVFFIQSKELGLPEMLVQPENFFHKIGGLFGMQDIDFEQWPEFSNKFLVQGDEWGIRRVMNDDLAKFFLVERHWCVESIGYYLILYRRRTLAEPAAIKHLFGKGMALYEHLLAQGWNV